MKKHNLATFVYVPDLAKLHGEGTMMKITIPFGDVELASGVVPVTEAASSLALLLKRVRDNEHIVLTQKGRTAAVIVSIEDYTRMRELALQQLEELAMKEAS